MKNFKPLSLKLSEMKKFFERNMFWVALIFLLLLVPFRIIPIHVGLGSWDLNRTIGWGWDVSQFLWSLGIVFLLLQLVFTIGYAMLKYTGRSTNFYLSLVHFLLMLGLIPAHFSPMLDIGINAVYLALLLAVFILNMIFSVRTSS